MTATDQFRQVGIVHRDSIKPSPANDSVYRPPQPDDADIQALAASMIEVGVLEPLTITRDGFILSGHRRYCASGVAGIAELPVIVEEITSDSPDFMNRLVTHNKQRVKSIAEVAAEAVVEVSAADAHRDLQQYRVQRSNAAFKATPMELGHRRFRSEISPQKADFLRAAIEVLERLRDFWPVSVRTVHYQLLNDPPLRNTTRRLPYVNDENSSKDLSNLLTTARFEGLVPFEAIHDPTRPVTTWNVHRGAGDFVHAEVKGFLRGYWRDLLQSQPDHIEVVGEKSTLTPIIEPVCMDYTTPLTIGRGYCSVPPRKAIHDRFRKSGKRRLVLVVLSDHDPDGEQIATSFARSMRDDFAIPSTQIAGVRAALSRDQVHAMKLPPSDLPAKAGSSGYRAYVEAFGPRVYELEAVPPVDLQRLLREAIESVLDLDAFKEEQRREREDALELDVQRQKALAAMRL